MEAAFDAGGAAFAAETDGAQAAGEPKHNEEREVVDEPKDEELTMDMPEAWGVVNRGDDMNSVRLEHFLENAEEMAHELPRIYRRQIKDVRTVFLMGTPFHTRVVRGNLLGLWRTCNRLPDAADSAMTALRWRLRQMA